MSHPPRADHCRNCQQDLRSLHEAHFCPHCGQETVLHPPTLWEFVHEFITHYVALEGALWRSLRLLMLKPGQLTREYFNGRRRHFVLPLRLYLTASFVFFLVLKLTGSGAASPPAVVFDEAPAVHAPASGAAASGATSASTSASMSASTAVSTPAPASVPASRPATSAELAEQQRCLDQPGSCGWLETQAAQVVTRLANNPAAQANWLPRLVGMAPYAVFLMLPVFAGLVQLMYWRRRMPYGEHFVFSLHLHSVWFIVLLVANLLPGGLGGVVQLTLPVYGVLSMHAVYGGRWLPTLARAVLLSVVYGLLLTAAAGGLTFWVLLHG